ncbi:hypothetical protein [Coleofasciculus sp. F4-SAH-05]|uniref:hypothetical protein n=1 Tax=Coleofasciculus sp. F4-SAH-05 TaxID=3069525 RepID=UPI0032F41F23
MLRSYTIIVNQKEKIRKSARSRQLAYSFMLTMVGGFPGMDSSQESEKVWCDRTNAILLIVVDLL